MSSKPQTEFETAIKTLKTDRYVKYFKTKALFVVHLYAQIRKKDSLRDIVCGLEQNQSKWYHLGLEKIKRSTISDALVSGKKINKEKAENRPEI